MLHELSLFSGYGGFSLGLRLAGLEIRTIAYCEIEPYCQEIIKARIRDGLLDDAPIWDDIRTLRGEQFRGLVDIITAGFPCQPFSTAGRRRAQADDKNLWPKTAQVISDVRPQFVLLENSGIHLRVGRQPAYAYTVLADLARLGYVGVWGVMGASDVGAPHRRKRWWCLATNAHDNRRTSPWRASQQAGEYQTMGRNEQPWQDGPSRQVAGLFHDSNTAQRPIQEKRIYRLARAADRWPAEPSVGRVADGVAHRVDRLKALGNGIVSSVVAEFLRRVIV